MNIPRMLIAAVITLAVGPAYAQQAALFDELAPLFPDTDPATGAEVYRLDTPRGVPAGVHVLVRGLPAGAEVQWQLRAEDEDVAAARAFRLIDVPVEQNTGLNSRTEAWDGQENPHVIRRAPFRVFEVLEPIERTGKASNAGVLALRLELPIAPDAKPGLQLYGITLEAANWRAELQWFINVHAAVVPPVSAVSPGYTNWFSLSNIAERHKVELWGAEFWELLGQYADLMRRGRQTAFLVPWQRFMGVSEGGPVMVARTRFQRYAKLFLDRGFTIVEGGHLAGRHEGNWASNRLDLILTGTDVTSTDIELRAAEVLSGIQGAIRSVNLASDVTFAQHLADEPTDTNAEAYQALAELARQQLPNAKIFEATMSEHVVGAVDWWCPQVQEYQKRREFYDARRPDGGRIWVYTCLSPGGPWLNRLLDQERVRPVLIGWALVKYDLAGFLHWGLNQYRSGTDPFEQSVVPHGDGPPNFLPAGDAHIVYPGANGPLSSVRFEAHRIGLEDAELLRILKDRDAPRADALIDRLVRGFDDYEKDVTKYRVVRKALLEVMRPDPSDAREAARGG